MGHDHSHAERRTANEKSLTIVLALTTAYLLAEVVGGIMTKSLALLADAGHMLTDAGGLALALMAMRFARRPATPERTYGYHRVEILAAMANAIVLVGISLYILYEAYERFRSPPKVQSTPMMVVAGIGLVVNVIGIRILRKGSDDSLNMKGAYFEVYSDLLTSIAVLAAGVIMLTTGWYYADPILSAGIGLFILPRTWKLLKDAVGILLEGTPSDVNLASLREGLGRLEGVDGVHDLHVWALTSGMNALSAHLVLGSGAEHDAVLQRARSFLAKEFEIAHVTLQVERGGCAEHETHL